MPQTDQTGAVGAVSSKQLVGPGSGWNSGTTYYDISKYDSLSFKFTFNAADAGKQIVVRAAFNKTGAVDLFMINLPNDGSTSFVYNISLAGKNTLDGMFFYNGEKHWTFTYTAATTQAINIDYIALKTVIPTALDVAPMDSLLASALPYGLSTNMKATFTPSRTTYNAVTWESLDPEIATVNADGVVTAGNTKAGTVSIKATSTTYPTLFDAYDVIVTSETTPVSSVALDADSIALKMLNTKTLTHTVLPALATIKKVTWSSADTTIAKVDQTGKITPIGGGLVDIIVTTEDGSFADTCKVTVSGFKAIPEGYTSLYTMQYNESDVWKPLAENMYLGANVPAIFTSAGTSLLGPGGDWNRANKYVDLKDFTELQVACTFNKEDIGKFFEFRYAFSKASGEGVDGSVITNRMVQITAEDMLLNVDLLNDTADVDNLQRIGALKFRTVTASGNISFNVDYVAAKISVPDSIFVTAEVDSIAKALPIKQSTKLIATITPANAVNKNVIWSSLNPEIATVSETGVVTANRVNAGTATIQAMAAADSTVIDSFEVVVFVPHINVEGVKLTEKSTFLELGLTKTLAYTILPDTASNKDLKWVSADDTIVSITNGVLKALNLGDVRIYASSLEDSSFIDSCLVHVVPQAPFVSLYSLTYVGMPQTDQTGAVDAISSKQLVGPGSDWNTGTTYYDISKYDSLSFKFTFDPSDAGKQIVVRAAFNKTGGVNLFKINLPNDGRTSFVYNISLAGKTSLDGMYFYNGGYHWSFTYSEGGATTKAINIDYIKLKTVRATGLDVAPADSLLALALPYGLTTTMKANFTPSRTTYNSVIWESSDDEIATVDANGVVTAGSTKEGTVSIKATSVTYPDFFDSYDVIVAAATMPVSSVVLDSASTRINMLNTKTLAYTVLPALASNKNVTWSTSDEAIATVDQTGKVTAVAGGLVDIIVTTEDGSFADTCKVTIAGFRAIPEGYVSLYTMDYNEVGVVKPLAENLMGLGATVPAKFTTAGNSLLGPGADWNRANKYVDLIHYTELQVACTFNQEDIGKSFEFRYAFSKAAGEGIDGSIITNRMVQITEQDMLLTIDLLNDVADVDKLRRVGAVKFRTVGASGEISFNVDYVAAKSEPVSGISDVKEDANRLVDVYSITGNLIRKSVKASEATNGLVKGLYIVGNKKVVVTK